MVLLFFLMQYATFHPPMLQDTINGCHCNCYSRMDFNLYVARIDSIGIALHQKFGRIIGIGSTAFNSATFVFIVKEGQKNKGFYYDLLNNRQKVVVDKYVDSFAVAIKGDSAYIVSVDTVPKGVISHDWSYYINYDVGMSKNFIKICQSQVYKMNNRRVIGLVEKYWLHTDRIFPMGKR